MQKSHNVIILADLRTLVIILVFPFLLHLKYKKIAFLFFLLLSVPYKYVPLNPKDIVYWLGNFYGITMRNL